MSEEKLRQELDVEIAASPAEVWKSISEGPGIERWFVPAARVNPGVGGEVWVSWGPGMEGAAPVHLWEEGRALGWTEPSGKIVEWRVEPEGTGSRMRLLQVGGSTSEGITWTAFLESLRFGLERHLGEAVAHVANVKVVAVERGQLIAALSERMGVDLAGLAPGTAYRAELAGLAEICGERLMPEQSGYFVLTVREWNDSLFLVFVEAGGGSSYLTIQCILFGVSAERAEGMKGWLVRWMDELVEKMEVVK